MQGVFFRSFVSQEARSLGLVGYVHNLRDGTVEVWAEGERQALEKLTANLNQGPPAARVSSVATEWGVATGNYADFRTE